jgi:hypothetical protein
MEIVTYILKSQFLFLEKVSTEQFKNIIAKTLKKGDEAKIIERALIE